MDLCISLQTMRIGFDAKRIYHNTTGLGNYSRTLVNSLAESFPDHQYYLYNPKPSRLYTPEKDMIYEVGPTRSFDKIFSGLWRSRNMVRDMQGQLDLFHGLSNELPLGIDKSGIPSVVTIHDLIYERYPDQYAKADRKIYSRKVKKACEVAHRVLATSEITKNDLISFYQVPETKIQVHHQSCHPRFYNVVPQTLRQILRSRYKVPENFILYVGSIIERKNLLSLVKAFQVLNNRDIQVLVIGRGDLYEKKVWSYILRNDLSYYFVRMNDRWSYRDLEDMMPALYQMAKCLVYPSHYEGYGIPVLEAHASGCPVLTTAGSSMAEIAGDAALYFNSESPEEIAAQIQSVLTDHPLRLNLIQKGKTRAQALNRFSTAQKMMDIYREITGL